MKIWNPVSDEHAGYLFSLSEALCIAEDKYPEMLTSLEHGNMIIASDYSGQHKEATHEAYSFVATTDHALNEWLPMLQEFRRRWLPDGRRISFKKLNEPLRWRALPAYLALANKLRGNLITILIDHRVGSFTAGGPMAVMEALPDCFPQHTKLGTVEKMLRLANFVAFILAGLRKENQESMWISDHDETLDSPEKREGFARLATYLTFHLTKWQSAAPHFFGTTESPEIPYWAEDIAALADLTAGTYCQMSSHLPTFLGKRNWQAMVSSQDVQDQRARTIGNWLTLSGGPLRHVLLRLETDSGADVRSSAQAFRSGIYWLDGEP